MNKEQLIQLKNMLTKEYTSLIIKNGIIISDMDDYLGYELEQLKQTPQAIEALTENFKKVMMNLSLNEQEFDEITIVPKMQILVETEEKDRSNTTLQDDTKILEDCVLVDFYDVYAGNNNKEIKIDPEEIPSYDYDVFYVSFKEFITGIAKEGFELKGVSNFNDLKTNSQAGRITIEFPKTKNNIL